MLIPSSRKQNDWRDTALILMVGLGAAVAMVTEVLSAFNAIRPAPLMVTWILLAIAGGAWLVRRERAGPRHIWSLTGLDAAFLGGVAMIAGIVLFIALRSAPNSTDAMGYHLPRVVYWAQAGSVAFFPVHYYAQIMMQPLAEYCVLQTYVLSHGDHFANLVQFFGFGGSILAVSLIARELGAQVRGQTIAAVLCATLPNAILQASGVKNDVLLGFWLAAMVFYALRGNALGTGVSLGLALATKGTAYVFAPPLLLGCMVFLPWRLMLRMAGSLVLCVLAINGPQYWRNYYFSGSVLGFPSVAVDQQPHFLNGRFSAGVTVSNLLRNLSEETGARSERWNRGVYDAVVSAHQALGLDVNDPASTFLWDRYRLPRNTNHETDANNKWHLLLFLLAGAAAVWAVAPQDRRRWWLLYAAVMVAFVVFCSVLRWQLFQARMHVPLFIIASALMGKVLDNRDLRIVQIIVCLFLLFNTRHYLLENWIRPLKGPNSILRVPRDEQYFADMTAWHNKQDYYRAVELTKAAGCKQAGIDNQYLQMEYPYQVLLREWDSSVVFMHPEVHNYSARYPRRPEFTPCAVFCMGCAGKADKRYPGNPIAVGDSILYLSNSAR